MFEDDLDIEVLMRYREKIDFSIKMYGDVPSGLWREAEGEIQRERRKAEFEQDMKFAYHALEIADSNKDEREYWRFRAFKTFQKWAARGYAEAQYQLGKCYYHSYGCVTKSTDRKYIGCYEEAARRGYSKAYYELGEIYRSGLSDIRDDNKAMLYYEKAIASGDDRGCSGLYQIIDSNSSLESLLATPDSKPVAKVISILSKYTNIPAAMYYLGRAYLKGGYGLYDLDKSEQWTVKAANALYPEALVRLSYECTDKDKQRDLLMQAAMLGNDGAYATLSRECQRYKVNPKELDNRFSIAKLLKSNPNVADIVNKALNGNADSMYELAKAFYHSSVDNKKKYYELWLKQAADAGCGQAQYEFGSMIDSYGSLENSSYLEKAMKNNIPEAFYLYASHNYDFGYYGDMEQAFPYYEKGAELGNADCMYKLGRAYEEGSGRLYRNAEKAFEYFLKAARKGNIDAIKKVLFNYSNKLTQQEINKFSEINDVFKRENDHREKRKNFRLKYGYEMNDRGYDSDDSYESYRASAGWCGDEDDCPDEW